MDETLRRLQMTQLEILQVIDSFCEKEKIKYSLYAGTLLGAVRHQGFIPWDDDLDICMERREYDRFLQAWDQDPPKGYLLQNKENTPAFTQSFSKVRKKHSVFLQYDWEAEKYHTGIFVDIFPIDRIPDDRIGKTFFQWRCLQYQLLTREFIPPKGSVLQRLVSRLILFSISKNKRADRREQLLALITKDHNPDDPTVGIERLSTIKTPLPAGLFDRYVRLPFEDGQFMCTALWDEYLKVKFGDYMALPPEEERSWQHHPILLDFEHDYHELSEKSQPQDAARSV